MIHFNAELWNIHQLFVLQILYEKKIIPTRKAEKLAKLEFSVVTQFQNVATESQKTQQRMSQAAALYRNKSQAERKPKMKTIATQFAID